MPQRGRRAPLLDGAHRGVWSTLVALLVSATRLCQLKQSAGPVAQATMISQVRAVVPKGSGCGIKLVDGELRSLAPDISKIKCGVVNLFLTAPAAAGISLSVNENCDQTVRSDMIGALERLAPGSAAAKTLMMSYPSLTLPVQNGHLAFGTWQGVYLARHRNGQESGDLVITLLEGSSQQDFSHHADKRSSHSVGDEVERALAGVATGICLVHEKHTSASLCVSCGDLEPAFSRVVPEKWNTEFFQHTFEGPDDMPGHVKSTLIGCSTSVPVSGGRLALGPEQQVLLHEHRNAGGWGGGHRRQLAVTVLSGDSSTTVQGSMEVPVAGSLTDLTRALDEHVAQAKLRGPGILQVFAQVPTCGVLCAEEAACRVWQHAVERIPGAATDPVVQAALAGSSIDIPYGVDGKLCLGPEQRVYLFAAKPPDDDGAEPGKLPVLLTAQGSKL
mmetsp:Transcript_78074/g.181111  ORF Transcript_78074/g.181111 Transcript_78074/m.181111 type:complete len:445 (+) Transcript_78074:91-1425(+)